MIRELEIEELEDFNPIQMFKNDWALITSGQMEACNTMTVSWGGFGHLWNKPVAFIFIRPQRYTIEFVEKNDEFSITFFPKEFKKTLSYLGSVSGKKVDKIAKSGLHKMPVENTVSFEEGEIIIVGKKIYADFIKEDKFLSESIIEKVYPYKDFHKMYIIEITKVLVNTKEEENI